MPGLCDVSPCLRVANERTEARFWRLSPSANFGISFCREAAVLKRKERRSARARYRGSTIPIATSVTHGLLRHRFFHRSKIQHKAGQDSAERRLRCLPRGLPDGREHVARPGNAREINPNVAPLR